MENEDMSELFNKFSDMLNNGDVPDDIKKFLGTLSSSNSNSQTSSDTSSNHTSIDLETLMKMKTIVEKMNDKDDPRANLLLSLKPYLKESRREKVDQYIKLFSMSKVLELFNNSTDKK